ncbi:MAG: tetratricopeptide repeat protein [Halofilum sp. (in: g-proteobacteria)]|nr:tetratricopeptide repeat protein [Halofilum sp. (in: g-proteobacteria)]
MNRVRVVERLLPLALMLAALLTAVYPDPADGEPSESSTERAEALWLEGATLHVEGDYEAAIARFRAALELRPTGRAHTWLAWSLSELGKLQQAVEHCRISIRIDPAYPNAYNDIGSYLVDLGHPREAERWLRQALEFDDYCCPHYAWYHLARSLLLQGRPAAAMDAVERSVELRSNYRPAVELLILLRMLDLRAA